MCKKAFHSECINKWFKKGGEAVSQDKSCPMCRQPFFGERARAPAHRAQGAWEEWEEEEEEEDDDDVAGWW